jgi:hypothetical protein
VPPQNSRTSSELVFSASSGCSPVLADQVVDDLSALDPGGHVDRLAGLVQRRPLLPRLMGPMLVVMPRVLGQDLPEVSFTVDQQVAGALGRSVPTYRSAMGSTTPSTAPDPDDRYRRVRVTHRFHPLSGRDFEFVVHRRNWGEDRVCCRDVLDALAAAQQRQPAEDPDQDQIEQAKRHKPRSCRNQLIRPNRRSQYLCQF